MEGFERENETAKKWRDDAARPGAELTLRLRLAAMAGHLLSDIPATRRAALVDVLADGRPHSGEELMRRLATELGENCWGKRPNEALMRDIAVLRRGGIRVAYSRRPEVEGYYLEYPALGSHITNAFDEPNDSVWLERVSKMTVAQKNEASYAAAEFALRQKRALANQEHPDWPDDQVDREARRLVFQGAANG